MRSEAFCPSPPHLRAAELSVELAPLQQGGLHAAVLWPFLFHCYAPEGHELASVSILVVYLHECGDRLSEFLLLPQCLAPNVGLITTCWKAGSLLQLAGGAQVVCEVFPHCRNLVSDSHHGELSPLRLWGL